MSLRRVSGCLFWADRLEGGQRVEALRSFFVWPFLDSCVWRSQLRLLFSGSFHFAVWFLTVFFVFYNHHHICFPTSWGTFVYCFFMSCTWPSLTCLPMCISVLCFPLLSLWFCCDDLCFFSPLSLYLGLWVVYFFGMCFGSFLKVNLTFCTKKWSTSSTWNVLCYDLVSSSPCLCHSRNV